MDTRMQRARVCKKRRRETNSEYFFFKWMVPRMESIDPYFFIRRVLIFMVDIFIRIKYNFPRVLHLIKRRRMGQKKRHERKDGEKGNMNTN